MEEFDLQPGERVITTIRQHPFVFILSLLPFAILAAIPAVINGFIAFALRSGAVEMSVLPSPDPGIVMLLTGFWWLFVWMAAFSAFTRYYLTLWVITTTRIVDIRQHTFFSRNVSSFLLLRVQDVTTDVNGLLGTLIGYGSIKVQTAGHDEDFVLEYMPHPQIIRDLIMDQVALLHAPASQRAEGL